LGIDAVHGGSNSRRDPLGWVGLMLCEISDQWLRLSLRGCGLITEPCRADYCKESMMPDVVEQILDLARWAPSGDNTQPWRFEILNEHHVVVHGFDTREHCIYDLNGFGSQIAHGALLETLSIAATGFGRRTEISRRSDSTETNPLYDVYLSTDEKVEADPLFTFIERRCTQRRPFRMRPLSLREKQALTASVGNSYTILWIEGWSKRWAMAKLLFASARIRLTIPEAYDVHRAAIQWNTIHSEGRIPDAAIGLDPLTLKLMRWAMGSWERVDFLNTYLGGHLLPRIELDLLPALRCASHVILLRNSVPQGIEDHVDAGRAVQRFWLTATKLGLQVQPEMTPLIFARYVNQGISLTRIKAATQRAKELATELAQLMGEPPARAVFMGRVGQGHLPRARSMRLPLADLLQVNRSGDPS
jgi:sulfur-carrier protein adenylyltransferase/sulfurtransferase